MLNTSDKIIKHKTGLLNLAEELGNVSKACQVMGMSRDTFYRYKSAVEDGGVEALFERTRRKPNLPIPDGKYELKGFAADEARSIVLAFGVFHGTQTGEGGPVPPTGATVASDYVYAMEFAGGKITHMTKIWNDGHALSQLGWA